MALTATVGREEELDSIRAFVDDMTRHPSAMAISGPAGIGKTVLWEAGLDDARSREAEVLVCRGVEAEASLSFAALSELITPIFDAIAPELMPPRRRALEVALRLVDADGATPDPLAIGLALLDVLRVIAAHGPCLIAIDDAQWVDSSSATVLQLALKRLDRQPVGALVTSRDEPGTALPIDIDKCFPAGRRSMRVEPISAPALQRLLRERLGLELVGNDLERVHAMTGGNPFFALEVGREMVRTGARTTDAAALRVPDSLRELVGGRLARLPAETSDVLIAMSALARPTVEVLARAHGDRDGVLRALDVAAREGVVRSDGGQLRFSHPLHSSVCYQQAPVWKQRAIHLALADAVDDPEERALHLARAADGPDERVAVELEEAAEIAATRGAPGVGAELLMLAATLTPEVDSKTSRQRRLRAAHLDRLSGNPDRALKTLGQLRAEVPSGPERADALYELSMTRKFDIPAWVALCDEALQEAATDDVRSANILLSRTYALMLKGDVQPALADAWAALELGERAGAPEVIACAIARIAHAETYGARPTPGLSERGVELERSVDLKLDYLGSPRVGLARRLWRMGRLDEARVLLEEVARDARARGDELTHGQALWGLGTVEWLAGNWTKALENATLALQEGELFGEGHLLCITGRVRGPIEADLGLVDDARRTAERGAAAAREMSDDFAEVLSLGVLGRVELMLGNLDAAASILEGLPGRLVALGIVDPTAAVWADAVEALLPGADERAHGLVEEWESHVRQLDSPLSTAMFERCRGLIASAAGEFAEAEASFQRSLAALEGVSYPFERARTLLSRGAVLRQAHQRAAARESLEAALAIFDELGGVLWAERARTELARISGRRAASEALTDTERQVATLAAQGQSNKEIAASLHMGVSTVESHLSSVYRKLDVKRAQLASALDGLST
jgi:DNA-binding CsgD family transcriptional regulator